MSTTETLTETVAKIRKHYSAVRTVERNLRLRRYVGRNSVSTERGLDYHQRMGSRYLRQLPRRLQGLLWEEHQLAQRISENKDLGNDRPELRDRIRVLRNAIKTEIEASR